MALTITEHPTADQFSEILALADPDALVPNKMFQRVQGRKVGNLNFSGTYTGGAPSTVYAKIIRAHDSATVKDWTALSDAAISGGNWSGTFENVPQGDVSAGSGADGIAYKVMVNTSASDTGAVTSTVKFRVGINIALLGQSNALGAIGVWRNPGDEGVDLNTDCWMFNFQSDALYTAATAWTNNFRCCFAYAVNALSEAEGCPVSFTVWAKNAVNATWFHPGPTGTWDSPDANTTRSGQDIFTSYGRGVEFLVVVHGEANSYYDYAGTSDDFLSLWDTTHGQIVDYCGVTRADVPMLMTAIGMRTTDDLPAPGGVIASPTPTHTAQAYISKEIIDANRRYFHMHCTGTLMGEVLQDNIHYVGASHTRNDKRIGQALKAMLGHAQGFSDLKIAYGQVVDGTTTNVMVQHGAGNDITGFTTSVSFTGFEVFDGSQWVVATGNRVDANTIAVTTASSVTTTKARRVRYAGTNAGPGANPVVDNATNQSQLLSTGPEGMEPQALYRTAASRWIGWAPRELTTGYPEVYPTYTLGKWQKSKRHITIIAYDENGDVPSGYLTLTIHPNRGRPVVMTVPTNGRKQYASVHTAEISGWATEFYIVATRASGAGPSQASLAMWQTDKNDLASTTPTIYHQYFSSVTSGTLTLNVPAHGTVLGMRTHFQGGEYQALAALSEAETPYWASPMGHNGFPPFAFHRFEAAADASHSLKVKSLDSSGASITDSFAIIALVYQSNYEALTQKTQAHNGGRTQVNLCYYSSDVRPLLLNRFKAGGPTVSYGALVADAVDEQGYPTGSTKIRYGANLYPDSEAGDKWIVRWKGTAQIEYGVGTTISSYVGTFTDEFAGVWIRGTDCAVRVTLPTGSDAVGFEMWAPSVSNTPYDVEICREDELALLDAGEIFRPSEIAKLAAFKPHALRWVQEGPQYDKSGTRWSHRMPPDYSSWGQYNVCKDIYFGEATLVGDTYTLTAPGWTLEDKACIILEPDTQAPPTCYLNVNGTGAFPIYNWQGENTVWAEDSVVVYDAARQIWHLMAGDGGYNFDAKYPYEIMAALSNELGAHAWIHHGPFNCDPCTDMTDGVANFMAHHLDPWLQCINEIDNEPWQIRTGSRAFPAGYYWAERAEAIYPGSASIAAATRWKIGFGRAVALANPRIARQFHNDRDRVRFTLNENMDEFGYGYPASTFQTFIGQQLDPLTDGDEHYQYLKDEGIDEPIRWITDYTYAAYTMFCWWHVLHRPVSQLQNEYSTYASSWLSSALDDVYTHAMAIDDADTTTSNAIEDSVAAGPDATAGAAHRVWWADTTSVVVPEVISYGLTARNYEGGMINIALGAPEYGMTVSSITRGNPTVVNLTAETAKLPPAGQYVTFDKLYGAAVTLGAGSGWTVITVSGGNVRLIKSDGSRMMSGAATYTSGLSSVSVGDTVSVFSTAGLAELNDLQNEDRFPMGYQILSASGQSITIDVDSSGYSAPISPPPGTSAGVVRVPFIGPVTAISSVTSTTIVTIAPGVPLPSANETVRLMGPWSMTRGATWYSEMNASSGGMGVASVNTSTRKVTLNLDSSSAGAYGGSGEFLTGLGVSSWAYRLFGNARHRTSMRQWQYDFLDGLVTNGIVAPSMLYFNDQGGGYHGLFLPDRLGGRYASDPPLALGFKDFNDPTPSVPTIVGVTPIPSSGTNPLTVNFIVSVTGYPAPTLVLTKDSGSGTTTIHSSTTTSFSHQFSAAGTYTIGITATNSEGSDSDSNATTVTVTEGGSGGGGSVRVFTIGSAFFRLPNGNLLRI